MRLPTTHPCDENDLKLIREALQLTAVSLKTVRAELHENSLIIGDLVEIQPVRFDCRELSSMPCWLVRSLKESAPITACSCGLRSRTDEIGTYESLAEAIAAAVGEMARLNALDQLPHPAAAHKSATTLDLTECCNDFIRYSNHRP